MGDPILQIQNIKKSFGGLLVTNSVSLTVERDELHSLIGPNGAGKTTLVGQISGEIKPDSGDIKFNGKRITFAPIHQRSKLGIARSFQITSIFNDFSVIGNVALAVQARTGHSFRFWKNAEKDISLRKPALSYLELVGLESRANAIATTLSHGEHRQLEIAMALATEPELLLLDEPTAGMSEYESTHIISLLRNLKGRLTIILVEHDMRAVFALSDNITVLYSGQILASGKSSEIQLNPSVQKAYLGEPEI